MMIDLAAFVAESRALPYRRISCHLKVRRMHIHEQEAYIVVHFVKERPSLRGMAFAEALLALQRKICLSLLLNFPRLDSNVMR